MRPLIELHKIKALTINMEGLDGGCGVIRHGKLTGSVIWSFGGGWEHVSIAPFNRKYTPSWDDMCYIKDMFFKPEEWAVQYHPAKSEYVNIVENRLHLWRPINEQLPTPPQYMP